MSPKPASYGRWGRVLPALSLPQQYTGGQGLGSVGERLDGHALACSLSWPGIAATLAARSLPGGQGLTGETSTGGAQLPGHLLQSARTPSPRPLASRALAAAGDRCSGTGRQARAEERQQVTEPRAQLCSYCVCLLSPEAGG